MLLREFTETDSAGTMEEGVLKDVLIHGSKSRNKREYTAAALRNAVSLYENAAVYADHPNALDREKKGRDAADRFGVLRNVRFVESDAGPQIRGDLFHLVTHPLSPRVEEDQRRNLKFFGLSHLADGTGVYDQKRKITMVESIDKVTEVDLVTNPATALSLREQEEMASAPPEKTPEQQAREDSERAARNAFTTGVESILVDPDITQDEKLKKIEALFKASFSLLDNEKAETKEEQKAEGEKAEALTTALTALTEQVKTLVADNTRVQAELAELKKKPNKYLGNSAAETLALAEQAQTIRATEDAFPDNGTPAEKASWLRRHR